MAESTVTGLTCSSHEESRSERLVCLVWGELRKVGGGWQPALVLDSDSGCGSASPKIVAEKTLGGAERRIIFKNNNRAHETFRERILPSEIAGLEQHLQHTSVLLNSSLPQTPLSPTPVGVLGV